MFVRLVLAGGLNAGMVAEIKHGYYLVGRHDECQIRPASASVSDRHCLLQHEGKNFRVLVLDDDSPTYVNHRPLQPKKWVLLNHGDILRVGNVPFLVTITAKDPLLPRKTSSAAGGQSSKLSRPSTKPLGHSPASGEDFARKDTAELDLEHNVSETTGSRQAKPETKGPGKTGRWKQSKQRTRENLDTQSTNQVPKNTELSSPLPPARKADQAKRDWRAGLATGTVVLAFLAGVYGVYRYFNSPPSNAHVIQGTD